MNDSFSATKNTPRFKTIDMVYIALFSVLIGICSWISIPAAVPFTMQTFAKGNGFRFALYFNGTCGNSCILRL